MILNKFTENIKLNEGKMNTFPLKSGKRQFCPFSPYLNNLLAEVLSIEVRQEKIKGIQIGNEEAKVSIHRWYGFKYKRP